MVMDSKSPWSFVDNANMRVVFCPVKLDFRPEYVATAGVDWVKSSLERENATEAGILQVVGKSSG